MKIKPRIFIGSSSKCIKLLDLLYKELIHDFELKRWDKEFFEPSKFPLECLEEKAKICDYAIFILHPDDIIVTEKDITVKTRDNVIFEYGLFMGVLGRDNIFLLEPNPNYIKVTFPSDFYGITTIRYAYDGNEADLIEAGIHIKEQIEKQEKRKNNINSKRIWPLRVSIISCDTLYTERLKEGLKKYESDSITLEIYNNYSDAKKAMDSKKIDCIIIDVFSINLDEGIDVILYARDRHREIGFSIYGTKQELHLLTKINGIRGNTLEHYWKLQKDINDESFQISIEDTLIMFFIYKLTGGHFGEMSGTVIDKIFRPNVIGMLNEWEKFV